MIIFNLARKTGIIFNFMGTILDRIQKIASYEGIKIGALERQIGASKGVISRAINNGTDIQSKWIQIIVENYPLYSAEWLLTGRGDMLKTNRTFSSEISTAPLLEQHKDSEKASIKQERDTPIAHQSYVFNKGIPLIPLDAMAGALTYEQTVLEYECERYIVPAFKGADFLITIKGDSMLPTYKSGDMVACKRIPMTDYFFQWNKAYIVDTDQGALIKRIKPAPNKKNVFLISDNNNYDPIELPLSSIHAVALVLGVIRLE